VLAGSAGTRLSWPTRKWRSWRPPSGRRLAWAWTKTATRLP